MENLTDVLNIVLDKKISELYTSWHFQYTFLIFKKNIFLHNYITIFIFIK